MNVETLRRNAVDRVSLRLPPGRAAPAGAPGLAERGFEALPAELAFLLPFGAPAALLFSAAAQARAQAIPPEAALLADGAIQEIFFYRSLAHALGVVYIDSKVALGPGTRYPGSIHAGGAPLSEERGPSWLAAPRGAALADLLRRAQRGEPLRGTLAIATPTHLSRLVRAEATPLVLREASYALAHLDPNLSAKAGPSLGQRQFAIMGFATAALVCALAPAFGARILALSVNCLFLATIVQRLFIGAASVGAAHAPPRLATDDRLLPAYSIVVALHREARVVAQLAAALEAIDYPRGKLDIKLVIEEDDHPTRLALEALRLPAIYEIVVAPAGWPRTKPRALNIALPLLRGEFVAIFDAEDAPAPRQLRDAAERFLRSPRDIACLQAQLSIDNVEDSWLTRLFSIEYAMLFDVMHRGMAGLGLPLPLGGTSNHFRTEVLHKLGGWDAWNVTEDADLGMRLARFGYRSAVVSSSTQEEAPSRFNAWLTQRRRWSKGWMQTFITLSRNPLRLVDELGARGAGALVLLMTGLVIAPPLWPFLAARTIHELASAGLPAPTSSIALVEATLWISVAVFGAGSTLWLALLGMKRRKLLGLWPFLPLLLPYYLMMSIAAWAALFDLIRRPYHWHKTEHGLAKSSRQNTQARAAAIKAHSP
ncbi:glycosyltransferase family 2 protein [Methylocapsa aurea]|uniref:glycosyltransferase family 2 protein n=1 Tax=Methylocapsa aurea TaxID=663610 RepID=UPI000689C1FE|nr:glycosyltransferase [Methylocapsa aurea]